MIIVISGCVGCGKSKFAEFLSKELSCELISLNEEAKKYKLFYDKEVETYEVDSDKLINDIEKKINVFFRNNIHCIIEGHFAHLISPRFVDKLIIINRPLDELKEVYEKRGYNFKKINENLEAESFDVCYFEAIENGFEYEKIFKIKNSKNVNFREEFQKIFK